MLQSGHQIALLSGLTMKIVGFPVDVSLSQDRRVVAAMGTRRAIIQATLDLIQAGDVEPTATAVATIAGVSTRALFQHFISLSEVYAAAFDLATRTAFSGHRPVDGQVPLARRIELLVAYRAQVFEDWLPIWNFAARARAVAPSIGFGVAQVRDLLRERLSAWFATELGALDAGTRRNVLDALDRAFGLDNWMNMRGQLRLSPMRASRTWRFNAEAIVLQALTVENHPVAVAA